MTDKQLTPMKKLSYNLRLLKQQLSNKFDVLELTETQSHSYRYEYTKEVKSDYILIFTSKINKDVNFAFTFNYKGELESDYTIDITIKEKDGNIKSINTFTYLKFKEVLHSMVRLGIKDESIINYILLLNNVKCEDVGNLTEKKKQIQEEFENKVKSSRQELLDLDDKMYKEYIRFCSDIKKSEEYNNYFETYGKLKELETNLNKFMRRSLDSYNLHKEAKSLLVKEPVFRDLFKSQNIRIKLIEELKRKYSFSYNWRKLKIDPNKIISKQITVDDILLD